MLYCPILRHEQQRKDGMSTHQRHEMERRVLMVVDKMQHSLRRFGTAKAQNRCCLPMLQVQPSQLLEPS